MQCSTGGRKEYSVGCSFNDWPIAHSEGCFDTCLLFKYCRYHACSSHKYFLLSYIWDVGFIIVFSRGLTCIRFILVITLGWANDPNVGSIWLWSQGSCVDVCKWQMISHSVFKDINGTHFPHTKLIYEKYTPPNPAASWHNPRLPHHSHSYPVWMLDDVIQPSRLCWTQSERKKLLSETLHSTGACTQGHPLNPKWTSSSPKYHPPTKPENWHVENQCTPSKNQCLDYTN